LIQWDPNILKIIPTPPGQKKVSLSKLVSRNNFDFLYVIGKGGFGKVWKVTSKKYKKSFALKEMSKVKVIDRKSERSIIYERDLLSRLKHPFIVNMIYAFQDYDNLYLVMDLLTGGDLRYHISRQKKFTEEQTSKIKLILNRIFYCLHDFGIRIHPF
jgi:protein kinase A